MLIVLTIVARSNAFECVDAILCQHIAVKLDREADRSSRLASLAATRNQNPPAMEVQSTTFFFLDERSRPSVSLLIIFYCQISIVISEGFREGSHLPIRITPGARANTLFMQKLARTDHCQSVSPTMLFSYFLTSTENMHDLVQLAFICTSSRRNFCRQIQR